MTYKIKDTNPPTGPTRIVIAPTLEDLRLALNALSSEGFNLNIGWYGWDDGSVIGHADNSHLFIEHEETD